MSFYRILAIVVGYWLVAGSHFNFALHIFLSNENRVLSTQPDLWFGT